MQYEVLINIDKEGFAPYQLGEQLVSTYVGTIDASLVGAPEAIWMRHNMDDRPDGQVGPSLSIGDVIKLWNDPYRNDQPVIVYYSPESIGFVEVTVDENDVERTMSWSEVFDRKIAARKAERDIS